MTQHDQLRANRIPPDDGEWVTGSNYHHVSLLKIVNKIGSLLRGLGVLRHFLSLSLSLFLLLSPFAVHLHLTAIARLRPQI